MLRIILLVVNLFKGNFSTAILFISLTVLGFQSFRYHELESSYKSRIAELKSELGAIKDNNSRLKYSLETQNKAVSSLKEENERYAYELSKRIKIATENSIKNKATISDLHDSIRVPNKCQDSISWLLDKTISDRNKSR